MTQLLELEDEIGNIDLCECDIDGTRVIRVISRIKSVDPITFENNSYSILYQHACGYRD